MDKKQNKSLVFTAAFLLFILTILFSIILINRFLTKRDSTVEIAITPDQVTANNSFSFYVLSDQRNFAGDGKYDTDEYFKGAITAINTLGKEEFLVIPGDLDPVSNTEWTIEQYLGKDYKWYPVVGNHELPSQGNESYLAENINLLRNFDLGKVNPGPKPCETTTYSFNYQNSHFVILNEYCDLISDNHTDGDISDLLYDWLKDDLYKTNKENIFVFGHEPAYPQPDKESGRMRHAEDSLNTHEENRDRFWNLLSENGVDAYICGHTHNYSTYEFKDVWQIDVGHARGLGDTESKSTFIRVTVNNQDISIETFRLSAGDYELTEEYTL